MPATRRLPVLSEPFSLDIPFGANCPAKDDGGAKAARKQRKWAGILALTADESIQTRDPSLTMAHLEVLRFLGLAKPMRETRLADDSHSRVQVWLRMGQPLWGWQ